MSSGNPQEVFSENIQVIPSGIPYEIFSRIIEGMSSRISKKKILRETLSKYIKKLLGNFLRFFLRIISDTILKEVCQ